MWPKSCREGQKCYVDNRVARAEQMVTHHSGALRVEARGGLLDDFLNQWDQLLIRDHRTLGKRVDGSPTCKGGDEVRDRRSGC